MTFPWEIHIVWSEWKKITVSCIIRSVLCGNRSGALVYASGMARWPGWNTKQNVPYMYCSDVCMFAFTEGQEGNSISPPYLEFAYEFVCLRKIQPRIDWTVACLYEKEEINTHTKKKRKKIKKDCNQIVKSIPTEDQNFNTTLSWILSCAAKSAFSNEIRTNLASD